VLQDCTLALADAQTSATIAMTKNRIDLLTPRSTAE
jgi:hypothetical protein